MLKVKAKDFPNQPGVYFFKDGDDRVLYVGKAINLKKRVGYYLKNNRLKNRAIDLPGKPLEIGYIVTNSELESLLLEARLIKQYQPKYNVKLKDDRRYLSVGITNDAYPRLVLVRQPEKEVNLTTWFGPFPSAKGIAEILRLLRPIFPYCTAKKCSPERPCFYYHLRLCPGVGIMTRKDYRQNIKKIALFLNGEISGLVQKLTRQMQSEAAGLNFEKAAQTKKQIEMIQNLLGKEPQNELAALVNQKMEAYDIANLSQAIVVGAAVTFANGRPEKAGYRQFKVATRGGGDPAGMKEILGRRLAHREWPYPQLILIDGGRAQLGVAFEALKVYDLVGKITLLGFAKRSQTIIIPKVVRNEITGWQRVKYLPTSPAFQILRRAQDEAHRFAQRYYKKTYQKTTFPACGPKRKSTARK